MKVGLYFTFSLFCLNSQGISFLFFFVGFFFFFTHFCFVLERSLISNISFDRFTLFYTWPERRRFEEFTNLLDVQVREMKSMTNAIRKFEGTEKLLSEQEDIRNCYS